MLQAQNLCLTVPGKALCADLSVTMRGGECWAILGQNGSGKTTLLHALSGLIKPVQGEVLLHGAPLNAFSGRALAQQIGVLLQEEDNAPFGTVQEYVSMGRFPHGNGNGGEQAEDKKIANAAIAQMALQDLAQRQMRSLSGGERQRARIAMLLAQSPLVYCLDEPLLHLDVRHQIATMQWLRNLALNQQKIVLMVLHDPAWASRYCDHVILLYDEKNIVAGASRDMLNRPALEKLYQCSLDHLATDKDMA